MNKHKNDISNLHDDYRKRRSSVFKPTIEDDEIFKKSVQDFLKSYSNTTNVPFTWERLSTGYRVVDFEFDKIFEAFDLLRVHFFCLNQSCAAASLYIDHNTFKTYQHFLLDVLADCNSLCALEEGSGEIIGVAMAKIGRTDHDLSGEEHFDLKRNVFDMVKFEENLLKEADIWENYDTDNYFCIHAVCVKPDCYNKGVATALVRACLSKAQKIGNNVCIGIFPAGPSQTIARKLNFKILSELPWINLVHSYSHHQTAMENSYVSCMGITLPLDQKKKIVD